MDPLSALGACSSILQIVDFSCKILSKGNELRTSFSGALPENEVLEKVTTHLHGLVDQLRRQAQSQSVQQLNSMIVLCINAAGELLDVLDSLKVHGPKTRWKSFRAAVKSVWRKEKVDEMLGRLQLIRDEIEFGVILDLRDELVRLSTQQSARFDTLDQSTKAVLQAVLSNQSASTAASNSQTRVIEDMNMRLQALIVSEHQRTRIEILDELRQQNAQASTRGGYMPHSMPQIDATVNLDEKTDILIMLKFEAIDDRHSAIPDAHRRTFEWIWRAQSRTQFWQWLTMEGGIYWVSGKAGSGKSTLMKYIFHDDRTSQGLQHWSNGVEVVLSGFFFWNTGSSMQKSLLGLLQSILYEILHRKPELKEDVFPIEVQNEVSLRWKSRSPDAETIWTVPDLKAAFDRLLKRPNLKICLFIDGLDEYDGDHDDVTELFKGILASPSVKACLSSRPLVLFERSFSTCPRLRLQDLTYKDISLYVREKLEGREEILRMSLAEPSEFQELVEEVIVKASGVFLWVTLAVRSLLEGLRNFDRMVDLRYRLQETPDDLSQLYWHILRSIKPAFYFTQAAKLLRIASTAYSEDISLRPEDLAFAEEYEFGVPVREFPEGSYQDYVKTQAVIMKGRLASRCRGFLEVKRGKVSFLHLSVLEFLKQPDVERSLNEKILGQFNPYSSLLASHLVELKNRGKDMDIYGQQGQDQITLSFRLARKAEEESGITDMVLTNEIDQIFRNLMESESPVGPWSWRQYGISWAGIAAHRNGVRPFAWNDTFVSLCLQNGLLRYVAAVLDKGEPLNQGPGGRPLLDFIFPLLSWQYALPQTLLERCRLLLEYGADPNEMFQTKTVWERLFDMIDDLVPIHQWLDIIELFIDRGADIGTGLVEIRYDGSVHITPVGPFILEKLIRKDRKRVIELYNRLLSLGGARIPYLGSPRPHPTVLVWDILPKPKPGDVPGPGRPGELNDFTPKVKNVKEYPDHEGMIPVSTEPSLSSLRARYSLPACPPPVPTTPILEQPTLKQSTYSRLKLHAKLNQHKSMPQVEQPSPQQVYTNPYPATTPTQQACQPVVSYSSPHYSAISSPYPASSVSASPSPVPSYPRSSTANVFHTPPMQQALPQQTYPQHSYAGVPAGAYYQATASTYPPSPTPYGQLFTRPSPYQYSTSTQYTTHGHSLSPTPQASNYVPVYQNSAHGASAPGFSNTSSTAQYPISSPAPPASQPRYTYTPTTQYPGSGSYYHPC